MLQRKTELVHKPHRTCINEQNVNFTFTQGSVVLGDDLGEFHRITTTSQRSSPRFGDTCSLRARGQTACSSCPRTTQHLRHTELGTTRRGSAAGGQSSASRAAMGVCGIT